MDALFHGPGWTAQPGFVEQVEAATARRRWICQFRYDAVRPPLAERVDLVVWLNLAIPLVMWRVA